jgi:type IV secretory pathway VirD2 relaxase
VNAQPQAWEDLSADDQAQHRQAQRVARSRVAEMRLDRPGRLEQAVFAGNIYSAFREDIDRARDEFLKQHLTKSSTMVDYLHLEILRSLAHDDERLLGADYPGPMA